jgi:hypothetical protein
MSLPDNYIGISPLYCGRAAPPSGLPLWALDAPLNAWVEIPNTSGAGGTNMGTVSSPEGSYSGWAKLPSGKIAIALAGGHTDGTKNNTVVIDLLADAPAWVEVSPESPAHAYEVAYEADGKPASCHTYYTLSWVPAISRLMRFGAVGVSITGNTNFNTVDGINLSPTPALWDAAGTYANVPNGTSGACFNPVTGKELLKFATHYYDPATGVATAITTGGAFLPRNPWCYDTTRNQMFGLCYGDNQQADLAQGILRLTSPPAWAWITTRSTTTFLPMQGMRATSGAPIR